jgi:hypothetical protein
MIVTLPAPVAERLADDLRETPAESNPVPHEVALTVSEPELVVTRLKVTQTPHALFVPFAAVPLIVTLPAPVAEMFALVLSKTPREPVPVPHEVPLTVSEPELVVMQDEYT